MTRLTPGEQTIAIPNPICHGSKMTLFQMKACDIFLTMLKTVARYSLEQPFIYISLQTVVSGILMGVYSRMLVHVMMSMYLELQCSLELSAHISRLVLRDVPVSASVFENVKFFVRDIAMHADENDINM